MKVDLVLLSTNHSWHAIASAHISLWCNGSTENESQKDKDSVGFGSGFEITAPMEDYLKISKEVAVCGKLSLLQALHTVLKYSVGERRKG